MSESLQLTPIPEALEALARGEILIVLDDDNRENEGDFIMAASAATPSAMGFIIRHSSGYVCAPMTAERAASLELPLMVPNSEDPLRTAYTVSCDARAVQATGISAVDRAITVNTLARGEASDLLRPGHILPLIARDGGVRERPGHTEAAVELTRLAGLEPVGVIAEAVFDDGSMRRAEDLSEFAREHGLGLITIEQLIVYLNETDRAAGGSEASSGVGA